MMPEQSFDISYDFKRGDRQWCIGLESIFDCNARCVFCCFGYMKDGMYVKDVYTMQKWWKPRGKKMDWSLFERIMIKHNYPGLILCGLTEPFLDDRLPAIVDMAKNGITIFSNASVMKDKVVEEIVQNPNFKSINFSLNAMSDETRMKVMGLSYKQAERNILKFLELRREYGRETVFEAKSPLDDFKQELRVGISFVAVKGFYGSQFIDNTFEIPLFKEYWTKVLREYHCNFDVGIFPAGNWAGFVPREAICQKMERLSPEGCGQWDCTTTMVDVDGNIMLCCYSDEWSFGSILDDDALYNWHHRRKLFGVDGGKGRIGKLTYHPLFCRFCSHKFIPEGWK